MSWKDRRLNMREALETLVDGLLDEQGVTDLTGALVRSYQRGDTDSVRESDVARVIDSLIQARRTRELNKQAAQAADESRVIDSLIQARRTRELNKQAHDDDARARAADAADGYTPADEQAAEAIIAQAVADETADDDNPVQPDDLHDGLASYIGGGY